MFVITGVQSKMERRHPMYPDFGISKRLESFKDPPSQPPKGKDVLERFFDILYRQPKNSRSAKDAATAVTEQLLALWTLGDARIPLNAEDTVKKAILTLREDLAWLNQKAKKKRANYESKVKST